MTNDPRSPLFDLISDMARQADHAYRMAHPTPQPAEQPRQRVTEHEYARAKAAAAIVKLARVWAGYLGTVAEGSASYTRDANHLSDAVAHYEMLCAKDES